MPEPADAACRLEIRGLVQGVGYRWAMVEEARRLGLRGWVRNRRDGSVEAVVGGAPENVRRIVEWAHTGPVSARVDSVEAQVQDSAAGLVAFAARPTA